jgi:CRP/FNR family transcriptional regulator, anaerobic regulatory protein
MRRSALTARLQRYIELTAAEHDALDWAERRERRISAGDRLVVEGDKSEHLYVVQHGWLHSSVQLASGGRQILRFHYAGDLVGTSSIAWHTAAATLTAVEDCTISELPKANLGRLFAAQPRLAGVLYAVAAAETVALSDRLTAIGRMGAIDRLATLLLDTLARLRTTAGGVVDSFDLPLTQADLGDAVGLTKVHVNRTFREMEARNWIERQGRRIRIVDEALLARTVGFVDRYDEIATDWVSGSDRASAA